MDAERRLEFAGLIRATWRLYAMTPLDASIWLIARWHGIRLIASSRRCWIWVKRSGTFAS